MKLFNYHLAISQTKLTNCIFWTIYIRYHWLVGSTQKAIFSLAVSQTGCFKSYLLLGQCQISPFSALHHCQNSIQRQSLTQENFNLVDSYDGVPHLGMYVVMKFIMCSSGKPLFKKIYNKNLTCKLSFHSLCFLFSILIFHFHFLLFYLFEYQYFKKKLCVVHFD